METNTLLVTDKELAEIYQRNVDTIFRLCYMYLKNTADAEDAIQSVFLKLIKAVKKFNDFEHEKAWLIITTKNHCKDILKNWWKSNRVSIDSLPEISSWDNNNEKSVEVLEQLLLLPSKYKEVLYLYYYEEYSIKEISTMLERKESTIQTQLSNGRKRLKISLGGIYSE